ncbi:UBX domain-containing protein 4 [Megalopta genalis]|uniref:UBX domain-containing protein 4 n=1 Tax=Megalopta genalis TaxID=115081 RepID=UPI001442E822|nr:UBX domain-containing protein 4 [Megalopta genalis]
MKWFEGSINEAVATSKSRKAIFVVFVEGKDDTSVEVAAAINDTQVSSKLEQDDFVAIRLESGTENCRHFAQIYQLVPVPSVFFIGTNGSPLEIVAGTTTANDLQTKIETVLTKAGKNKTSNLSSSLIDAEKKATASGITINTPSTSSKPATNLECDSTINSNTDVSLKQETVETKVAEETKATKVENESSNVATENANVESSTVDKSKNVPSETSEPQEASTKTLAAEENVKKASPVIDIQPRNLVQDEERKEKLRELECRKDFEMRQAREERLREKAQDAAAREKVRQQIAQDKLERKQKERDMQQQMQKQPDQEASKPVASVASKATVTRIQFRLPSGNPHMGQFESSDTLRDLRNYVIQNIDLPFHQFAMSISFPRRELTAEENDKTLLELELVPTAVVLILPLKNSGATTAVTSTQDVGFFSRIMWTVFAPIMHVYNYLMGYFSGGNQSRQRPGSPENNDTAESSDGTFMPNLQNVANSSGLVRRYLGDQGGTTIKTEGNIHRLHSGGDDNDENNTWNGNSTQQM